MRLQHGVIFVHSCAWFETPHWGSHHYSAFHISLPLIGIAFCSVPVDQSFHCPWWSLIVCVYSYCLLIDKILMALAGLDTLSIDCFLHVFALSCCWDRARQILTRLPYQTFFNPMRHLYSCRSYIYMRLDMIKLSMHVYGHLVIWAVLSHVCVC